MRYTDEEKQIEQSLKVSSYTDAIYDKIVNKKPISTGIVPNYGGYGQGQENNENSSLFSFDPSKNDNLFKLSSQVVGLNTIVSGFNESINAEAEQQTEKQNSKPKMKISKNQAIALSKWPALIEILGTEYGEKIAKDILIKINGLLVDKIYKNSQKHNKYIYASQQEKSNMKFFYKDESNSWICCVTASGPFRGDEIVYYNPENDSVSILRKFNNDFEDVSNEFKYICESAKEGE